MVMPVVVYRRWCAANAVLVLVLLAACGTNEPAAPAQLAVVRQPNEAVSGKVLGTPPVVEVHTASGARAGSGAPTQVTARLISGTGALVGATTVATVNGVATFSSLRVDGAGTHRLQFEAAGLTSASSVPFQVVQLPAALAIDVQPDTSYNGRYGPWQVTIRDHANLRIAGASLPVTAELASGSGRVIGTTTVAAFDGRATFNALGVVGLTSYTMRFFAAGVSPALSAVIPNTPPKPLRALDVGVGGNHMCALTVSRDIYCWGGNNFGQVGSFTGILGAIVPQRVVFSEGWHALAVGLHHTCAIDTPRRVWCWGERASGVLGYMPAADAQTPTLTPLSERYTTISSKAQTTCVLSEAKRAYCWGTNVHQGLGAGTTDSILGPVAVVGGLTFDSLSTGSTGSCALTAAGAVYCWGATPITGPDSMIIGNSSAPRLLTPTTGFREVVATVYSGCARAATERWWCWGSNLEGRYGNSALDEYATPTPIPALDRFTRIFASMGHTCAIEAGGAAFCWGANSFGQLGDGTTTSRFSPVPVAGGHRFTRLSTHYTATCGITTDQRVLCWGAGPLGDSTRNSSAVPVEVTPP